ncbi:hypothetical protein [Cupriavidus basilensis]|uniref:hypothetical protein n=1 Tax=Cupriavidus basilensis TaxID=68895 RepID=UPI0039F6D17D
MKSNIYRLIILILLGLLKPAFSQSSLGLIESKPERPFDAKELATKMLLSKSVVVYLAPLLFIQEQGLTEEKLRQIGCRYETDDGEMLAEMARLVGQANPEVARIQSRIKFEPREAIYLRSLGGSQTTLLFDRYSTNVPNVAGLVDNKKISASQSIVSDIYRWAAKLAPVEQCESFLRQYR